MLKVTVTAHKHSGGMVPVADLEIENDMTGDDHHGNYLIRAKEWNFGGERTTTRFAKLTKFRRARGALALVKEALTALNF